MNSGSQENRLFLYCTDLDYYPENPKKFIRQCQEYGLISAPDNNLSENDYRVGDRFLQYITFMGCSPYLKIEPEDEHDRNYCYVHVEYSPEVIRFVSGKHTTMPVCPACKKTLDQDSHFIRRWHEDEKYTGKQLALDGGKKLFGVGDTLSGAIGLGGAIGAIAATSQILTIAGITGTVYFVVNKALKLYENRRR